MSGTLLHCPIRGQLVVPEKAKDGITFTEEKRRIDCIKFLLQKGYPKSHFLIETTLLKFGNAGRNSFRTDLSVLDVPASSISSDIEVRKRHIKLIAEIKRGNKGAPLVKATQVKPALDFVQDISALGIYWDDVEQRLFYRTIDNSLKTTTHETVIAAVPQWGQKIGNLQITRGDLRPAINLAELFKKVEDELHSSVQDKSRRYSIMMQLLLAKLYDEYTHPNASQVMTIQDFGDSPMGDSDVATEFDDLLLRAVRHYGKYLPPSTTIPPKFGLTGSILRRVSSLISPVSILSSKREVIQAFYMYFANAVYKWELAQFFTPVEMIDLIVSMVNPQAGDQVKDPACGSGDFLISAFQYAGEFGGDLRQDVWGADSSANAVDICVINMILNGDGKANIKEEDSIANVDNYTDSFSVMLCNPPFGSRIVERDFDKLKKFDLGHVWSESQGGMTQGTTVASSQEVGILFAELCVKQAVAKGRIGIILPNGYLGNRSPKYLAFREWLLRNTRLVAVVGFPRFTFKKSGADVSASVLLLEKRDQPLARASDSDDYPVYFDLVESVGWNLSSKKAEPIFARDLSSGAFLTDVNNDRILDADFKRILNEFRGSLGANVFPWVTQNLPANPTGMGWSVRSRDIVARSDLSIDPKRWCQRAVSVRDQIQALPHLRIGDVAEVIRESGIPDDPAQLYEYVEIQDTSDGVVNPSKRRGWELPTRARHRAKPGDIFVGGIWNSVNKWFVAGGDTSSLVVSNGFHRLRMKVGKEDCLIDLVTGLNTEAYRIQARSFATGSDGLAELSVESLQDIVLPKVGDPTARQAVDSIVTALLAGRQSLGAVVRELIENNSVDTANVQPRKTNWVQV